MLLLASQSMTAGVIATHFDSARPTISKHIKVLTECELVKSHQRGREIHYEVNITKMKEVDQWLKEFQTIWENRFAQLDEILLNSKNDKK